jgi:L-lactate dehydrogenase complex protein LldG
MSARDEILARVRAATAGVEAPARPALGGSGPVSVDLFAERVADYRAVVERCTPDELADRVAAAVEGRVVVPAGLGVADALSDAVADDDLTATELDQIDTVVTEARVGIAETGTIVLDHGPGQGRRALSLVPDRHVCIVRADQVVADVPDAVALLDPTRPLTWISGPSATSDIELDRVEGVHGPRNLHVIVVEP